jgi:hypothetical protein
MINQSSFKASAMTFSCLPHNNLFLFDNDDQPEPQFPSAIEALMTILVSSPTSGLPSPIFAIYHAFEFIATTSTYCS